jgi:hypothetical protein
MIKIILISLFLISCGAEKQNLPTYRYETRHGIRVDTEGNTNAPSIQLVETWTQETLDFWNSFFMEERAVPEYLYAYFLEQNYVIEGQNKYGGFAFYKYNKVNNIYYHRIVISNGPIYKVRYVFDHELSHILLDYWYNSPNGNEDHSLMKSSGFNRAVGKGYAEW